MQSDRQEILLPSATNKMKIELLLVGKTTEQYIEEGMKLFLK